MIYPLPFPLHPGNEIKLKVEAEANITAYKNIGKNDYYNTTGWMPRLWWEYEVHADYDVNIEINKDLPITTSGRFNSKTGGWHGKNIRSFAIVIARKDLKITESHAGETLVRVLAPNDENSRKCAELILNTATEVIHFYRKRFGFYPADVISLIPGYPKPWGGYPMATNVVVIHGMPAFPDREAFHWQWITAHEIGHQYFIEHVLEKDSHYWLVIGLGIYADWEWARARNMGKKKHHNFIMRYKQGVIDRLETHAVRHLDYRRLIDFDYNNVVVHGKGYCIIAALESVLGKKVFNNVYFRLLKEFKGLPLGTDDFQKVCEEVSGQNLEWFFSQWVHSSRYISYTVQSQDSEKISGKLVYKIKIKNQGDMMMPVPVRAVFSDNSVQETRTNRLLKEETLVFESSAELKEIQLDPENIFVNIVPLPKMSVNDLHREVKKMNYSGDSQKAKELFSKAKKLDYAKSGGWVKLGLNLYEGKLYKEALYAFRMVGKYLTGEKSPWHMGAWGLARPYA
jgi:hypothetical protein